MLGSGRFAGHAVWHVSFYDPRTPAWFLVAIDKKTLRTLDLHMTATAHFMHDTYGPVQRAHQDRPAGVVRS